MLSARALTRAAAHARASESFDMARQRSLENLKQVCETPTLRQSTSLGSELNPNCCFYLNKPVGPLTLKCSGPGTLIFSIREHEHYSCSDCDMNCQASPSPKKKQGMTPGRKMNPGRPRAGGRDLVEPWVALLCIKYFMREHGCSFHMSKSVDLRSP